ncbi:hypothetical protein HYU19_04600, partial [Candidatus Woesearchaeota archaeon]|nr:hypothetical protein [Candidatus Woesearchaeota archaeon]
MKRKMKRKTRMATAGPKKKRNKSKSGRAPARRAGKKHQQARTAANPFMPAPMAQYSPVQ